MSFEDFCLRKLFRETERVGLIDGAGVFNKILLTKTTEENGAPYSHRKFQLDLGEQNPKIEVTVTKSSQVLDLWLYNAGIKLSRMMMQLTLYEKEHNPHIGVDLLPNSGDDVRFLLFSQIDTVILYDLSGGVFRTLKSFLQNEDFDFVTCKERNDSTLALKLNEVLGIPPQNPIKLRSVFTVSLTLKEVPDTLSWKQLVVWVLGQELVNIDACNYEWNNVDLSEEQIGVVATNVWFCARIAQVGYRRFGEHFDNLPAHGNFDGLVVGGGFGVGGGVAGRGAVGRGDGSGFDHVAVGQGFGVVGRGVDNVAVGQGFGGDGRGVVGRGDGLGVDHVAVGQGFGRGGGRRGRA